MRLDLVESVHGNPDDDQKRSTAEVEVHVHSLSKPLRKEGVERVPDEGDRIDFDTGHEKLRNKSYHGEVDGADKGQVGKDGIDVVSGVFPWSDPRYEPRILSEVLRDILRVVDDGDIKIGEENDPCKVEQDI